MTIQPEYKKDMHKKYLILRDETGEEESYDMKMIGKNHIPGLLKVEFRNIDRKREYYYDITEKQPLSLLFQKDCLKEKQIKMILEAVISTLAKGKDYLLLEDNFILSPDYIYMSLEEKELELIYFSGYQRNIREQLMNLIEYMMNKADYQDKEAVFLIYGIYKISRDELCTYETLMAFLKEENRLEEELKQKEQEEKDRWLEEEHTKDMEVEIESEEEEKKYPVWVWFACVGSVLAALIGIMLAVRSGILYDVVTGKLLLGKMAAVFGIIGALEAYCLMRILDEENKIACIVRKTEYVKPVEEKRKMQKQEKEWEHKWKRKIEEFPLEEKTEEVKEIEEAEETEKVKKEKIREEIKYQRKTLEGGKDEREFMTVALAARDEEYYLSPENSEVYMPIYFPEFPFFIGTLKTKVDGVINSRSVSRFHAKFEKKEEQFYLTDLNSTNGTFLNGIRLKPNESRKITVGDKVSFADVTYHFKRG